MAQAAVGADGHGEAAVLDPGADAQDLRGPWRVCGDRGLGLDLGLRLVLGQRGSRDRRRRLGHRDGLRSGRGPRLDRHVDRGLVRLRGLGGLAPVRVRLDARR